MVRATAWEAGRWMALASTIWLGVWPPAVRVARFSLPLAPDSPPFSQADSAWSEETRPDAARVGPAAPTAESAAAA